MAFQAIYGAEVDECEVRSYSDTEVDECEIRSYSDTEVDECEIISIDAEDDDLGMFLNEDVHPLDIECDDDLEIVPHDFEYIKNHQLSKKFPIISQRCVGLCLIYLSTVIGKLSVSNC
jgi:hypothetical protein